MNFVHAVAQESWHKFKANKGPQDFLLGLNI